MLEPTTVVMWTGYGLFDAATVRVTFPPRLAITAPAAAPASTSQREHADERYSGGGASETVPAFPRRAFRARFG